MSVNIPTHFVHQFATAVQLLVQQKKSRFRMAVTEGNYVGKQASPVDQIGTVNMQPVTTRYAPMGRVDAPTDRRWVSPNEFDLPQLIDKFDKLKILTEPESAYVQTAVQAANRQYDDLIIDAFFGDAKTGELGATTTSFATYIVEEDYAASADVGHTVAKLRRAKRFLRANEVDFDADPIFHAMNAEQEDNLFAESQIISTDFNDRPVMKEGRMTRFMGADFIFSERLNTNSDSDRLCPFWAKSGMHLAMWEDIQTDISRRNDLQGLPWQAYITMSAGATRIEEKKIVQIQCKEA